MTDSERCEQRHASFISSLTQLADRLPRAIDGVSICNPAARLQLGWLALDIGKTLVWHSSDVHPELHAASDRLRRFGLGLLGEQVGIKLEAAECPLSARVAQLEAILKAREAA